VIVAGNYLAQSWDRSAGAPSWERVRPARANGFARGQAARIGRIPCAGIVFRRSPP
jgi:hypothetical protein